MYEHHIFKDFAPPKNSGRCRLPEHVTSTHVRGDGFHSLIDKGVHTLVAATTFPKFIKYNYTCLHILKSGAVTSIGIILDLVRPHSQQKHSCTTYTSSGNVRQSKIIP